MGAIILIPAYGRKYLSTTAALADWNAGKDFKILNGPYCSIRDLKKLKEDSTYGVMYVGHGMETKLWETWKGLI